MQHRFDLQMYMQEPHYCNDLEQATTTVDSTYYLRKTIAHQALKQRVTIKRFGLVFRVRLINPTLFRNNQRR